MLKLKSPFKLTDYVYPICLPPAGFNADNGVNDSIQSKSTTCIISGWGVTEGKGSNAQLQHATVPIMTNERCNELFGNNYLPDRTNMCAGYTNGGIDTCQGDSGGPLTCNVDNNWTLVGIVSWGIGCADAKSPGAYVRVSRFNQWIKNVQQKCRNTQSKNCKVLAFERIVR